MPIRFTNYIIQYISPVILCCLLVLSLSLHVAAQNIDKIGQEKPIIVSGGLNILSTAYAAEGIPNRRDPFTWIATGNLNMNLYGWSVPLSFSYTNNQGRFQQPFNRYGISPQYKWVKTYLGYHSLTYSSYTLNGHVFLGGGVALTPGKWRINAMYGRFLKAVEADTTTTSFQPPVYERYGMGTKVGYESKQGSVHTIVFYAKDDPTSVATLPDSLSVFPAQNLVVGLIARQSLGKRFTWDGEWAQSLLTRDLLAPRTSRLQNTGVVGGWLMPIRQSTTQHQAWKTGVTLALGKGFVQGQYERVDPDYQTLGAYFFNNDLENVTLGIGWQFWENRLNITAQGGLQNNNLDESEISQTKRWVSNYSMSFQPSTQWQLTSSYSNFTSFTNIRPQTDPFFSTEFDSLDFYQVNQNASLTSSYSFGGKEQKQVVTLSTTYQKTSEATSGHAVETGNSEYYTGNAAYRISMVPSNLTLSIGGNVYYSILETLKTTTAGPQVNVSKGLLEKKLRSSWTTSFNQVTTNRIASSRVLTSRIAASYSWPKRHQLSVNLNVLNNFPTQQKEAFSEWTATARYGFTF